MLTYVFAIGYLNLLIFQLSNLINAENYPFNLAIQSLRRISAIPYLIIMLSHARHSSHSGQNLKPARLDGRVKWYEGQRIWNDCHARECHSGVM